MHGLTCILWANLTPFSLQGYVVKGAPWHVEDAPRFQHREVAGGARSHCRVVLPLIRLILESLRYSVPLLLKR
jgi:hypothetical protein